MKALPAPYWPFQGLELMPVIDETLITAPAVLGGKDPHVVVEALEEGHYVDVDHGLVLLPGGVLDLAEAVQAGNVAHEAHVQAPVAAKTVSAAPGWLKSARTTLVSTP